MSTIELKDSYITDATIGASLQLSAAPIISCCQSDKTEVMRIEQDGRIFWKGREVDTDEDFRVAMLELRDAMMAGMGR